MRVSQSGNAAVVTRETRLAPGTVKRADVAAMSRAIDAVAAVGSRVVKLAPADGAPAAPPPAPPAPAPAPSSGE